VQVFQCGVRLTAPERHYTAASHIAVNVNLNIRVYIYLHIIIYYYICGEQNNGTYTMRHSNGTTDGIFCHLWKIYIYIYIILKRYFLYLNELAFSNFLDSANGFQAIDGP